LGRTTQEKARKNQIDPRTSNKAAGQKKRETKAEYKTKKKNRK